MAEWKTRGYVPDSDEEEEEDSQESGYLLASGTQNIHNEATIAGDKDDSSSEDARQKISGVQDQPSKEGARTIETAHAVEVRIPKLNTECQSKDTQEPYVRSGLHGIARGDDDVDELQEDHNTRHPSAQLSLGGFPGMGQEKNYAGEPEFPPTTTGDEVANDNSTGTLLHEPSSRTPMQQDVWRENDDTTRLVDRQAANGLSRIVQGTAMSDTSSLVSDAPSPPDIGMSIDQAHEPSLPLHSSQDESVHGIQSNAKNSATVQAAEVTAGSRFRQRNPIQLHPFLVEHEKYRRTLHSHGLKAIAMPNASQRPIDNDTQNQDFASSQSSDSSYHSAQRFLPSSPPALDEIQSAPLDELPDMDALLRSQDQQFSVHDYKRRRVANHKPKFKRPPGVPKRLVATHAFDQEMRAQVGKDQTLNQQNVFDVPPSPPPSGMQTPTTSAGNVRKTYHRPLTRGLPTPATSSEPRAPPIVGIFDRESSQERTNQFIEVSDASDSPASASENEPSNQLHRAEKRIRGVLPASWLKLDLKAQTSRLPKAHRPPASASPEKRDNQRGVARPIFRPRNETNSWPAPQREAFLSSDEGQASDTAEETRHEAPELPEPIQIEDDAGGFSGRLGEAEEEDDEVDAMLMTDRRRNRHTKRRHKLQTKMSDFGLQASSKIVHVSKKRRLQGPSYKKFSSASYQRRPLRPKFQVPKLSILDAPSAATTTDPSPQPAFLKIASRTVRSRQDKGKHSPRRKFLRLATRDDTDDANKTLYKWREGGIKPRLDSYNTSEHGRRPLQPRSANARLPTTTRQPKISAKSAKGVAAARNITAERLKPRKVQTALDSHVRMPDTDDCKLSEQEHQEDHRTDPNAVKTRKGVLMSSLRNRRDARPAMLETVQDNEDHARPRFSLSRHLVAAELQGASASSSRPPLQRFLDDSTSLPTTEATSDNADRTFQSSQIPQNCHASLQKPRTRRKRRPRRIDTSSNWQDDTTANLLNDELPVISKGQQKGRTIEQQPSSHTLTGLLPFGATYTSTFDVVPFSAGTCFHQSTFLGSGDFERSLRLQECDLDTHRGYAVFTLNQQSFKWGPWNEEVYEQMSQCFERHRGEPAENLTRHARRTVEVLHQVVSYFSNHLSFLDPIDRNSCLQRCTNFLSVMPLEEIESSLAPANQAVLANGNQGHGQLEASLLCHVFVNQLRQLSQHPIVSTGVRQEVTALFLKTCKSLADGIRTVYAKVDDLVKKSNRQREPDLTIRDNIAAEALVIAKHVLQQDHKLHNDFWVALLGIDSVASNQGFASGEALEERWKRLFTLLPLMEFDHQGVLKVGSRFHSSTQNWTLVKRLVDPVLDAYLSNPRGQAATFNFYCRTLFSRCIHLINAWGWRKCDSIIGTLFDFFARNKLNNLIHEQCHGSPSFLDHLNPNVALNAEREDRCFHLFLKIVGSGIKHMRRSYPEKKISNLIWRLMPNHGRSHPKEEELLQNDLDALRNHHDLLCTLYWSSPPSVRPRLKSIRDLVHVESSHKEVVQLNIRSWSYLVKFQLSTDEPLENLEPFVAWFDDLLQQILRQHTLARSEAEEQVRSVHHAQGLLVSPQVLESTIAANQRQVEAILSDALASLRRAIQSATSKDAAGTLLSSKVTTVFNIYNTARPQTNGPVIEALDVLLTYAEKLAEWSRPMFGRPDNDDSQEYGDWSAFNGDLDDIDPITTYSPPQEVHDHLRQLMSNCFGADFSPADTLLMKVVEAWVAISQTLVRSGHRSWTDYIGEYGRDAWKTLRDTDQRRKYTSYYLCMLLEKDASVLKDHKAVFFRFWLETFVERESLLKFQHRLTSAILNAGPADSLLENPPFWRDKVSNRFDISLREFSERRLSLIFSVLSNIRTSTESSYNQPDIDSVQLKQEYKDLLKHLMATMKRNYQELGQSSNVTGTYVGFVHHVIEALQQHVSDICSVDRFFTDNATFPLPATDPTYVVGQLKNYGLRLQDPRAPKELVMFLQSISERAAVDGQQVYLVDQLHTAMAGGVEESSSRIALREFVVEAVLPAYMELAFETPCGWILALPFLQALIKVFAALKIDLDGYDPSSVKAVASLITCYLKSLLLACTKVTYQPGLLERPATLKTLRAGFEIIHVFLPTLDYICRLNSSVDEAMKDIDTLRIFAKKLSPILAGDESASLSHFNESELGLNHGSSFGTIRGFAKEELRQTLEKNWTCVDGNYFLARGNMRREVIIDVGLLEEERESLKTTLHSFEASLRAYPCREDEEDDAYRERKVVGGMTDLMI